MRPSLLAAMLLGTVLAGCASEWRTAEPVTATTYTEPGLRIGTSVGRLGRLAVMGVDLHREADEQEKARPEWQAESVRMKRDLQQQVVEYLVTHKGYEARAVNEPIPADEQAMRETGRRLGVDGIVSIERWHAKPWSTGQAISNIFLLNIPLFTALNALNLRIAVHETASGRMVWKAEMKGELPENPRQSTDVRDALRDMENAVPAQLRR